MKQEITFEISPTGEVEIAVKGVKGKSCKALTEDIERALGKPTQSTPTREMTEREQNGQRVNQA